VDIEQRKIRKELDRIIKELEKQNIKHNDDYDVIGVGDVLESVLSKMGITQERFKSLFGLSECNCEQRKKFLNGIFYWHRRKIEKDDII
jgi:predicted flap endonuclease-1-like 5' DNA nuclease